MCGAGWGGGLAHPGSVRGMVPKMPRSFPRGDAEAPQDRFPHLKTVKVIRVIQEATLNQRKGQPVPGLGGPTANVRGVSGRMDGAISYDTRRLLTHRVWSGGPESWALQVRLQASEVEEDRDIIWSSLYLSEALGHCICWSSLR